MTENRNNGGLTASKWQPIETAPDDARVFLAWDGFNMWLCMKLEGSPVVAVGQGVLAIMKGEDATHWVPLPAPPIATCSSSKEA